MPTGVGEDAPCIPKVRVRTGALGVSGMGLLRPTLSDTGSLGNEGVAKVSFGVDHSAVRDAER